MRIRLVSIAGIALLAASAFAQSSSQAPASKKLIQLQLTADPDITVTVGVNEGTLARVGAVKSGWTFLVQPTTAGNDGKTVSVHVVELTRDQAGNESMTDLEPVVVNLNSTATTSTEPHLHIKLLSVTERGNASAKSGN